MTKLTVFSQDKRSKINRNIYGHFSEHLGRCIYGGIYVGEDSAIPNVNGMRKDVVEALRNIKIPVLRWPGGCFADDYHWVDGVGPKASRKRLVNTHWGGVVEDNSFGTHEFMELCKQLGCEPYINGNLGSGTVQEMSEWIEYMTFGGESPMSSWRKTNGQAEPWKLTYFGVGNESWGCGGNMRPEFYADQYRRYQTYVRNYGDNRIYKIACGPGESDYHWTDVVMELAGKFMDGFTLHHYTVPGTWENKGSATSFTIEEYYTTLRKALEMEDLITNHLAIMDRHDPDHRVGLIVDEWGTWYDVEPGTNPGFLYQQNTMRDAIVAALTLDIFNAHSDRVVMANLAQTVNVLQAVLLTEGDKLVLTPTYHVFDLYKRHHDAMLLRHELQTDTIKTDEKSINRCSVTASEKDGEITLTVTNISASDAVDMDCSIAGRDVSKVSGRILTDAVDAHNDFDNPSRVVIKEFDNIRVGKDTVTFTLPPCSVAEIVIA